MKLLTVLLLCLGFSISNSNNAVGSDAEPVLDGHSFTGTLKATNTWLRVGVKGSIRFQAGQFSWKTDQEVESSVSGPYQIKQGAGYITFSAQLPESSDSADMVYWQGQFDGSSLNKVMVRWQRSEQDFIHDLMLPEVVIFEFKPDINPSKQPKILSF